MMNVFRWHRSLMFQLGVISVGFTLFAILQVILLPVFSDFYGGSIDYTVSEIERELLLTATATPDNFEAFKTGPIIAKSTAANPDFRLYAETDQSTVSIGGIPQLDRRDRLLSAMSSPSISTSSDRRANGELDCTGSSYARIAFEENGTRGIASFNNCPIGVRYLEIAGIETPAFSSWDAFTRDFTFILSEVSREYLFLSGGVLLIGLFTLFRSASSVQKVANVTHEIDLNSPGQQIERKGLPLELDPIVDALNALFHRLDEVRDHQRFFIATAAHELRTPLTILRTRLDALPSGAHQKALIRDVRRMSRLVEQLLQLTEVRALASVAQHRVELFDLAEDVCLTRAPLASKAGVELSLKPRAGTVLVKGEPILIAAALSNLIDNAISVSTSGQRVIVEAKSDGRLSVRDFGPGIDDTKQADIFEPFAKYPPNRNGHGLGLAIVGAIMGAHVGHVSVSPPTDGSAGTCFELLFPE